MDDKELENDINTRNFSEFSKKCKILHLYTNKKTKLQTVILNAPANIYKYIRENKKRIFVGFQNCRVFDIIDSTPCSSCGRFWHSGTSAQTNLCA